MTGPFFVIAIDGPAGSGKSTVSRKIAEHMGAIHADSGAIYRSLTLACMRQFGAGNSVEEFYEIMQKNRPIQYQGLGCSISVENRTQINRIGKENLGEQIRTMEVTRRIRFIADDTEARREVNRQLRNFARISSLVVDGRDIGTVVFPETPYKFFLSASPGVRARRRFDELKGKGETPPALEALESEIEKRDREDENRPEGALRQANDAILIDTSNLEIEDVVTRVLGFLQIRF